MKLLLKKMFARKKFCLNIIKINIILIWYENLLVLNKTIRYKVCVQS